MRSASRSCPLAGATRNCSPRCGRPSRPAVPCRPSSCRPARTPLPGTTSTRSSRSSPTTPPASPRTAVATRARGGVHSRPHLHLCRGSLPIELEVHGGLAGSARSSRCSPPPSRSRPGRAPSADLGGRDRLLLDQPDPRRGLPAALPAVRATPRSSPSGSRCEPARGHATKSRPQATGSGPWGPGLPPGRRCSPGLARQAAPSATRDTAVACWTGSPVSPRRTLRTASASVWPARRCRCRSSITGTTA